MKLKREDERRKVEQNRQLPGLLCCAQEERLVSPDTGRRERASRHAAFIGANITRTGKTSRTSEHATSTAPGPKEGQSLSLFLEI